MKNTQPASDRALVRAAIIYSIVWIVAVGYYWYSLYFGDTGGGWIMGYILTYFYLALPAAGFISALFIARGRDLGTSRYFAPIVFAGLYVLATILTFSLSTNIGMTNIGNADLVWYLGMGFVPPLVGMLIGVISTRNRRR